MNYNQVIKKNVKKNTFFPNFPKLALKFLPKSYFRDPVFLQNSLILTESLLWKHESEIILFPSSIQFTQFSQLDIVLCFEGFNSARKCEVVRVNNLMG